MRIFRKKQSAILRQIPWPGIFLAIFTGPFHALYANDSLTVKTIGMELARDIANESVKACRKMGYQVSAVVVDRNGLLQAALRDDLASRFTLQIAEEKANSVILSGINSGEFRRSRDDIRPELNHMDDIIIMQGALPVEIAGSRIAAIGVSGAPGGEKDELCAKQALEVLSERIEFAD
jgi:uncharacterized protein GlcG (DUF336 family)